MFNFLHFLLLLESALYLYLVIGQGFLEHQTNEHFQSCICFSVKSNCVFGYVNKPVLKALLWEIPAQVNIELNKVNTDIFPGHKTGTFLTVINHLFSKSKMVKPTCEFQTSAVSPCASQ